MKRKIKKVVSLILCFNLMLSLAACGGGSTASSSNESSNSAKEPIVFKFSMNPANSGSWGEGAKEFAKLVNERTNGRYKVDVYPSDQLAGGNSVKSLEMLQQGAIDFVLSSVLIWSNIDQKIAAPTFPWLYASSEEALASMEGKGGEALLRLVNNAGAVGLAIGDDRFRQFSNNIRPITSPDDFVGMKFRVPGVAMYVDLFKVLGADPVTMNMSEVYTSLQQGAVDGQENPIELDITWKIAEVQKYLTISNYSYDPFVLAASHKVWDSLSDEDKEIFRRAAVDAMEVQKEVVLESEKDNIELLKDKYGIEITELTPEQVEVFREKAAPIYDKYKDVIGEDVFKNLGYEFK